MRTLDFFDIQVDIIFLVKVYCLDLYARNRRVLLKLRLWTCVAGLNYFLSILSVLNSNTHWVDFLELVVAETLVFELSLTPVLAAFGVALLA